MIVLGLWALSAQRYHLTTFPLRRESLPLKIIIGLIYRFLWLTAIGRYESTRRSNLCCDLSMILSPLWSRNVEVGSQYSIIMTTAKRLWICALFCRRRLPYVNLPRPRHRCFGDSIGTRGGIPFHNEFSSRSVDDSYRPDSQYSGLESKGANLRGEHTPGLRAATRKSGAGHRAVHDDVSMRLRHDSQSRWSRKDMTLRGALGMSVMDHCRPRLLLCIMHGHVFHFLRPQFLHTWIGSRLTVSEFWILDWCRHCCGGTILRLVLQLVEWVKWSSKRRFLFGSLVGVGDVSCYGYRA